MANNGEDKSGTFKSEFKIRFLEMSFQFFSKIKSKNMKSHGTNLENCVMITISRPSTRCVVANALDKQRSRNPDYGRRQSISFAFLAD